MAYWEEEEEEEEEENESYLASYSDLVTDLMAVFVLLLSFALLSQGVRVRQSAEKLSENIDGMFEEAQKGELTDVEKFVEKLEETIELAGLEGELSISRELPDEGDTEETGTGTQEPVKGPKLSDSEESVNTDSKELGAGDLVFDPDAEKIGALDSPNKNIEGFIKELREEITRAGLEGRVSVNRSGENRVVIRLMDSVLFDLGKADIKEEVKPVLDRIADILSRYDNAIEYVHIEGHTDTIPISKEQFPSNWELSTGRAGSVVRYLIVESSLKDEKFSAAGYGEFRPIADNTTDEGRSLNRRVEFSVELKDEAENSENFPANG